MLVRKFLVNEEVLCHVRIRNGSAHVTLTGIGNLNNHNLNVNNKITKLAMDGLEPIMQENPGLVESIYITATRGLIEEIRTKSDVGFWCNLFHTLKYGYFSIYDISVYY